MLHVVGDGVLKEAILESYDTFAIILLRAISKPAI